MVLEFLCPKGHKIRCPEERAGQAARCPKCGVKFLIPDPSESRLSETPGTSSATPGGSGSGVRSGTGPAKDQIAFLCPNGHLLHGPRRLQGHAGQCPECGSKFRIPTYDEPAETAQLPEGQQRPDAREEKPQEPEIRVTLEPTADSAVNLADNLVHYEQLPPVSRQSGERILVALQSESSGRLARPKEAIALYDLFCRLWTSKAEGALMEVRLNNGERLLPQRFAKGMSRGSHAVFGLKESDGTFSVAAVAWESICQIVLRQLPESKLPEELRD